MPARASSRTLTAFLLFAGVVGSISTVLWIGAGRLGASAASASILLALAVCVALTSLNLAVRWLRWHFLIRRYTRRLMTRDSLAVYLATLPAIVTPFFVGELVRVLILRRKSGIQTSHLAWVWLIERALDAWRSRRVCARAPARSRCWRSRRSRRSASCCRVAGRRAWLASEAPPSSPRRSPGCCPSQRWA
jgi:hypothetical protein